MRLNLNVLNHLGLNLYSNTPAVLSEVIANSYDADATKVKITVDQDKDEILIIDDGNGMSQGEINDKFLLVGYQKRKNGESFSLKYKRPVMGRKGIGKLSLFSIADEIEVHSIKDGQVGNALKLSREKLEYQIANNNGLYEPEEVPFVGFGEKHGTKIVITELKKNIARTENFLRTRLANRFVFIAKNGEFDIIVNEVPIDANDRNFFNKIQILWPIGDYKGVDFKSYPTINVREKLNGKIEIDGKEEEIIGWIGTVKLPSDLKDSEEINNNKISIFCRGKLAQEDILASFTEGGVYASYLIGEIHADFLDLDNDRDIATSNRQQIIENDARYNMLKGQVYKYLKLIQSHWTDLRNETAVDEAFATSSVLKEWYNSQQGDAKIAAKKLFGTINSLHFDNDEQKKKEVYKFGILAFEKLRVNQRLSELENLTGESLSQFGKIFAEVQDIEAAMYYDIASQRVGVIDKIRKQLDENEKEKVIQEHLYKNLWLLDPSWDRATVGTGRIEQQVEAEFGKLDAKLTEEEKKGRIDIRYKSTAGKHLIIELKRYVAGYPITTWTLAAQTEKYISALEKILEANTQQNINIEAICIVGPSAVNNLNDTNEKLKPNRTRVITYDMLITHALESYGDYLEKNDQVGKIRELINKL